MPQRVIPKIVNIARMPGTPAEFVPFHEPNKDPGAFVFLSNLYVIKLFAET